MGPLPGGDPSYRRINGYIGFLKREVPLYTGLMTALIGKGMQDLWPGARYAVRCYRRCLP